MTDTQLADTSDSKCVDCGDDVDIAVPSRLIQACHERRVLLFVGSGASTESHNTLGWTFYDEIARALSIVDCDLPFPDLMSAFAEEESRTDLILRFVARMRYIENFPELKNRATRFHDALGMIPYFDTIITTNWDDYFERHAACVPLVYGADFDYWSIPQRKVLKIHGSILNPGSIIATRSEYDRSLEDLRSGALGATAQHLLATHEVVFVGYSLRDEDIRDIIDVLRSDLASAAKPVYFVNPNPAFVPPLPNAHVLRTSAAYFLDLLDRGLVEEGLLEPRSMYGRVEDLLSRLHECRMRVAADINFERHPLGVYCFSYHDGLLHALQRIRSRQRFGEDRMHGYVIHRASGYDQAAKNARRQGEYWDESYIEGYCTGLIAAAAEDIPLRSIPMYYCPGVGHIGAFRELQRCVRADARTHARAFRKAKRHAQTIPKDLVPAHPPTLRSYG